MISSTKIIGALTFFHVAIEEQVLPKNLKVTNASQFPKKNAPQD
jgi:hypothetical protein